MIGVRIIRTDAFIGAHQQRFKEEPGDFLRPAGSADGERELLCAWHAQESRAVRRGGGVVAHAQTASHAIADDAGRGAGIQQQAGLFAQAVVAELYAGRVVDRRAGRKPQHGVGADERIGGQ